MTTILLNFHNAGFIELSAFYAGLTELLNELFDKTVLPLGLVTK